MMAALLQKLLTSLGSMSRMQIRTLLKRLRYDLYYLSKKKRYDLYELHYGSAYTLTMIILVRVVNLKL
jgi:hypothetical protein